MENEKDKPEADNALTTTAKTIGKAGKIAAVVSPARPKSSTAKKRSEARLRSAPKVHKLAKKNKVRVPRKVKKARKIAAQSKG
jgi:hypothetical protein